MRGEPTGEPTAEPSGTPTGFPTGHPTGMPTYAPTAGPTVTPTAASCGAGPLTASADTEVDGGGHMFAGVEEAAAGRLLAFRLRALGSSMTVDGLVLVRSLGFVGFASVLHAASGLYTPATFASAVASARTSARVEAAARSLNAQRVSFPRERASNHAGRPAHGEAAGPGRRAEREPTTNDRPGGERKGGEDL